MGNHVAAYARGYGGQLIHMVPAAGIVVAMTSGTSRAALSGGYMDTLHSLVETNLLKNKSTDDVQRYALMSALQGSQNISGAEGFKAIELRVP